MVWLLSPPCSNVAILPGKSSLRSSSSYIFILWLKRLQPVLLRRELLRR